MNDTKPPEPALPEDRLPSAAPPRRWPSVLLGAVILACGVVIGSGVTLIALRDKAVRKMRHPDRTREAIAERMRDTLGLSAEQVAKVEAVFRKRHEAMHKIREETRPRFQEQFDLTRKEVEAVLTPDQAKRWREHYDKMRRTWAPRRPGRRGKRPGPPRPDDDPPRPDDRPTPRDDRPPRSEAPREGSPPPPPESPQ